MIKKILARLGFGAAATSVAASPFYEPYAERDINFMYNLLFCDDLSLFKNERTATAAPWVTLFARPASASALQKIAQETSVESRVRMLAFNELRASGAAVPAKVLLCVIIEVPLDNGLDVLAAFADGSVRYLNKVGKLAVFEGGPPEVEALARDVVRVSQPLVDRIGPWEKHRLPPPKLGNVRMTFLVSDGLYFGEGPFVALQQDPIGGPVLAKASELLQAAVNMAVS